ncbi:MAG: hypothetical protein O2856_01455 [Planctomycetota bacterium]|nr:hypothetical protein [Planctomycetota bacterium]
MSRPHEGFGIKLSRAQEAIDFALGESATVTGLTTLLVEKHTRSI